MKDEKSTIYFEQQKSIQILGFAPDVPLPECSMFYAANRAAFSHCRKIEHLSERSVVSCAHVITGNARQKPGHPEIETSSELMETGIKKTIHSWSPALFFRMGAKLYPTGSIWL
jgi:hypothetical protein